MSFLLVILLCCTTEEKCPADYSLDQYKADFAEAYCYLQETCPGIGDTDVENCAANARSWVDSYVTTCQNNGAEIESVCRQWRCTREMKAAADADCATASNTCAPEAIFDDASCAVSDSG